MHSNLLLCRSHTPLSTSPIPSFLFYPSPLLHLSLPLPPASFYLHYSSSSELSLISPSPTPPIPCSPHPPPSTLLPSDSRQETLQDQTGASNAEHLLYQCLLSRLLLRWLLLTHAFVYSWVQNWDTGKIFFFWQKLSGHIRFAGLSAKKNK